MLLSAYISNSLYLIISIAYVITIAGIIGIVVSENRSPVKSLAWITVLLLLPLVGLVLYMFFGRSLKSKRMISRRNKRKLKKMRRSPKVNIKELPLGEQARQLVKLGKSTAGADCLPCYGIDIFTCGEQKFSSLKADIKAAKKFINLQYYIFENDTIGSEISELLKEKAREGVKVRIIYDHVGCFGVKSNFYKEMRESGIEVLPFMKVTFPQFATHINWRNHRKLIIIDGTIGYIGGMNIADRYIFPSKQQPAWRDTHLRVVGPVVDELQNSFAIDWNFMKQPLLDDYETTCFDSENRATDKILMQYVRSGPMGQWSNVAMMICHAIAGAKQSVFIQTPYFVPTESLLGALQTAALAKVDVRLMIPRRCDSKMLTLASFSFVKSCLNAGIKVYLYEPGMLHAKTMTVDDEIFTTGSTNFDFRSIECNFESNLFIYDKQVTARTKQIFIDDQQKCTRVTASEWRHRPMSQRIIESLVRLLSPIL